MTDVQPLSPEYLERLRALVEKATPGPWTLGADKDNEHLVVCGRDEEGAFIYVDTSAAPLRDEEGNAAFIAESRTAVPLLLGEVARLREALQSLHDNHGPCDAEDATMPIQTSPHCVRCATRAALDGVKGETR